MRRVHAVLLTLVLLAVPLQGCMTAELLEDLGSDVPVPGGSDDGSDGTDGGDGNDTDGGDGDGPDYPPPFPGLKFDGRNAWNHTRDQVRWDNGSVQYRVPGTPGREEAADEIAAGLQAAGWEVTRQTWRGTYLCERIQMENVVGTLEGRTDQLLILGAHYDTRPWADKAGDDEDKREPVPGANDGGSGVGALLELARALGETPELNYTVRMVFFDAEDGGSPPGYGYRGGCGSNDWIIGSTRYANRMSQDEVDRTHAFILLDMVGDRDLTLYREGYSYQEPHRQLQDDIWDNADHLGYPQFKGDEGFVRVTDDHRPFQERGIVAVDVIHLDSYEGGDPFPATHHKPTDTLDRISADSLEAVGRTVERTVYQLDYRLGRLQ